MTKTCSRCGVDKPLAEFRRQKAGKFGRRADCATCQSAYNRAWKTANRDKCRNTDRKYRAANLEKSRAYNRNWNKANRDRCDVAIRAYRERNPEKTAADKRAWRLANPDRVRQHKAAEYERNREKILLRVRTWQKENPERRRAQGLRRLAWKKAAAGWDYTTADHIAARWAMFGDRCYYCGADATSSDHRIPLSLGGSHWPSNIVPCCKPCNSRKNARTEKQFKEVMSLLSS